MLLCWKTIDASDVVKTVGMLMLRLLNGYEAGSNWLLLGTITVILLFGTIGEDCLGISH